MRRSRFTESEILHLLYEANAGVPIAEICDAAGIYAADILSMAAAISADSSSASVREMKGLRCGEPAAAGMINDLAERLRCQSERLGRSAGAAKAAASPVEARRSEQRRASRIAAEKCGGAVTGRFASVRVNP